MKNSPHRNHGKTSWDQAGDWYHQLVGESGHYYHQHVVLPNLLRLLNLRPGDSLLDIGCGQGILARAIPKTIQYLGVDASRSMIAHARQEDHNLQHRYLVADATQSIPTVQSFSHSAFLLSLQNINNAQAALRNTSQALKQGGYLIIVLNHPCFRTPRQTGWGIDTAKKLQYRRVDRYYSPLRIPIDVHPGQPSHRLVWDYHYSLSDYSRFLHQSGFCIELIEEWISDKQSVGPAAKMENFARKEFPLFLTIVASKKLPSRALFDIV